jgi:hypothetical protein
VRPHRLQRLALIRHVSGIEGLGDRGEIYVDPPDYSILNPVAPGLVNLSLVVPLAHAQPFSGRLETFFEARLSSSGTCRGEPGDARGEGPLMVRPLAIAWTSPVGRDAGGRRGGYRPVHRRGPSPPLRSRSCWPRWRTRRSPRDCRHALAPYAQARARRSRTRRAHAGLCS